MNGLTWNWRVKLTWRRGWGEHSENVLLVGHNHQLLYQRKYCTEYNRNVGRELGIELIEPNLGPKLVIWFPVCLKRALKDTSNTCFGGIAIHYRRKWVCVVAVDRAPTFSEWVGVLSFHSGVEAIPSRQFGSFLSKTNSILISGPDAQSLKICGTLTRSAFVDP